MGGILLNIFNSAVQVHLKPIFFLSLLRVEMVGGTVGVHGAKKKTTTYFRPPSYVAMEAPQPGPPVR